MRAGIRLVGRGAPVAAGGFGLVTLAAGAAPIATAWLLKLVLDAVAAGGASRAEVLWAGVGLGLAGLVTAVLPRVGDYLRAQVARKVALVADDELYQAVGRQVGLARLEDPVFLDRLRLAQQAAAMPVQLVEAGFGLARGVLLAVGFIGSLWPVSAQLTGLVLLSAGPVLLGELALARRRAGVHLQIGPAERRELFYRGLLDSAEAAKEIRLFGLAGFLRERMLGERRAADRTLRGTDRRELAVQGGLALLNAVVAGAGLLWAVRGAYAGQLSAGDVAMVIAALAGVQSGVNAIVNALAQGHEQLLLFDHLVAVTTAPPDLPQLGAGPVPPLRDGIELRDVWFRYSDEHPWVLRGVDLHVPAGAAVGLVGLNGSGKSTIVKLLCRFYDPTRGAVLWDGVDVRELDVAQLRRRIGAVFQDYMEYDLSAAENIAVGDLTALGDRERLVAAATRAGVHPVLDGLPHGYDTLLTRLFFGESDQGDATTGVRLSGGQWQRVALARAYLRGRHDLMILDEPSAGLDAEAEAEVHQALRAHRGGRTSVLVSHRLGTLRDADMLVVLSDGRVAEQGTHRELLAADGVYARLFRLQADGYQDDAALVPAERP
ncbi:multidrug ABC transporter permease [Catellatospora methionotrophica]|uniref:Multidrug ABC transporter permease n=1 Tax=Catellatospora methionotrophica TaxID=121620 RepID=A0A8J3LL22_9ACTN|nr:ABC transporter ATP-binding protein [Catellatospora methionotrophica]GIG16510.1 multidrug ABC transporter permease [Catellatospora methionotrophica]